MKTIILVLLSCSVCFAEGVWQGQDWKQDPSVLFADAHRTIVVKTDLETGKKAITQEKPVEVLYQWCDEETGSCSEWKTQARL